MPYSNILVGVPCARSVCRWMSSTRRAVTAAAAVPAELYITNKTADDPFVRAQEQRAVVCCLLLLLLLLLCFCSVPQAVVLLAAITPRRAKLQAQSCGTLEKAHASNCITMPDAYSCSLPAGTRRAGLISNLKLLYLAFT